jgi:hypothetical protein
VFSFHGLGTESALRQDFADQPASVDALYISTSIRNTYHQELVIKREWHEKGQLNEARDFNRERTEYKVDGTGSMLSLVSIQRDPMPKDKGFILIEVPDSATKYAIPNFAYGNNKLIIYTRASQQQTK